MSASQQRVCVFAEASLSLSFITSLVGGRHPSAKCQPPAPWRPLLHREAVLLISSPTRKSEPTARTDHSSAAALRSESGGDLGTPASLERGGSGHCREHLPRKQRGQHSVNPQKAPPCRCLQAQAAVSRPHLLSANGNWRVGRGDAGAGEACY